MTLYLWGTGLSRDKDPLISLATLYGPHMVSPDRNDPYIRKQNTKLAQVIQNIFSKSVQIIVLSRIDSDSDTLDSKINKWFNLHMTANYDEFKEDLRPWRGVNTDLNVPPLIIETYLDLRQTSLNEVVVLHDDNGHAWTVAKGGGKKHEVVLERWLIEFDKNESSGMIDELPFIYKQAIILFRAIFTYTRMMPAFQLKKSFSRTSSSLLLGNKVLDGKKPISSKGRIGLLKPILPHQVILTESHMSQKSWTPITTSVGTLRVSVAYRNHHDFRISHSEEVLLSQFMEEMKESKDEKEKSDKLQEFPSSPQESPLELKDSSEESMELEKSKKIGIDIEPTDQLSDQSADQSLHKKLPIQPFRIGSISNSPPTSFGLLERRVSITSNKSTSNASLAALLRNPRSSTIPINTNPGSFPRSVSSSHGHDEPAFESTATPRFSSSFGSRASRRFSNTSIRQSSSTPMNDNASYLGTSIGLTSLGAPLSGIYLDDDISDFVRMIDSKSDLRFAHDRESKLLLGSLTQLDALSKFQLLKSQHQHLGDSVSASLILQHNQVTSSRPSSRKSSVNSPSSFGQLPPAFEKSSSIERTGNSSSRNNSFIKSSRLAAAPVVSTTAAHATTEKNEKEGVTGMATTPSVYPKKPIRYENVFEDDDDDDVKQDDDDDLLFTMSDMNLAKE